jgi:serine/threonine protein kinase
VPSFPVKGWERYEPLRFLGQGGMGMVFLARDARLHRDVALKFVRGDDARSRQRLIAEARAQARVSHERVCKVYEVGEVSGQVYIAMQHIDGEPLSALAGRLTVEQKARIVRDAALGVHEAHRQGLIHRDLKPSNIMVDLREEGEHRPYVMDFGLARTSAGGTTETGDLLGTPHFMSPEQARGETSKLDRRVHGCLVHIDHCRRQDLDPGRRDRARHGTDTGPRRDRAGAHPPRVSSAGAYPYSDVLAA